MLAPNPVFLSLKTAFTQSFGGSLEHYHKSCQRVMFGGRTFQRSFLLTFQRKKKLTQRGFAAFLGVPRSTLKGWINEDKTLPKPVFDDICKQSPELEVFRNTVSVLGPHWGQVKGGKMRMAKEKDIHSYTHAIREAKEIIRITKKTGVEVRNQLVDKLIDEKVDLKSILAICLLTDGSLDQVNASYRISFVTTDRMLKDVVYAILFKLSKYAPAIYEDLNGVYYIRVCDFNLAQELLKLSPSFKKSPSKYQSIMEYLREKQPNVEFLNNCDERTQVWGIKFAFSADGSISIDKKGSIELTLSCAHPKLCLEWKALLENFSLKGKIGRNADSWSGIYGLRFYGRRSAETFLQLGGFVPGVRVTKNSKYYTGVEKNELLRLACRAHTSGPVLAR